MSRDDSLKHNPFAGLRGATAASPSAATKTDLLPVPLLPIGRLIVREEFDAEEKAVVVRVIGLPIGRLSALGRQSRDALGYAVVIEGRDLLMMSDDHRRIGSWLRSVGASEVVVIRRPEQAPEAGREGGTQRSEIKRGLRVAIVQKADQQSGVLTAGVVRDILTSSPTHPRGIKVRLESGQVGRVRRILG